MGRKKGLFSKPRSVAPGMPHWPPKQKEIAAKMASLNITMENSARMTRDRRPSGSTSGVVFMRAVGGQFINNPATDLSHWIRRKLHRPPTPKVTIMDGAGTPIAIYDPETKTRTPIDARSTATP